MKFMKLDIQKFAQFFFTVRFEANTGTGTMERQEGRSEDEVLKANTFTKEGCAFTGWNTSADGTGTSISEGMTLGAIQTLTQAISSITLYAQWQGEETPDKYMTLKGLQRYDTKIKEYMVKDCPRIYFITENSSSNPFIFEDHEPGIYVFYKLENNYSHPSIYFKATSSNTGTENWDMTPVSYMVYLKKPSQASADQVIAKVFRPALSSNNSYREGTFSVRFSPEYNSGIFQSGGYSLYLNLSECVKISGDQTIAGKKTFDTLPETSATVTTDNQLTNKKYVDGNFLSKANTTSYTPTSDYSPATKKYVDDAVGAVVGMSYEVVSSLPAVGENGKIYLVANSGSGQNIYDEYIWISGNPTGSFEKIGTTDINLNNYYTKTEADAEFTTSTEVNTLITNAITSENLVTDANYVHTDNNYTTAEKTKLAGVEAGAEANVIETVKVNGTALVPDANKAVDIIINTANPTNADIDGLFA